MSEGTEVKAQDSTEDMKTPEGAFVDSLKRSNKQIKASRAEAIGEAAYIESKRSVEDLQLSVRHMVRELDNMLDMSPDSALNLNPAKDFEAKSFFKDRKDIMKRLRVARIELSLVKEDHKKLFGEDL